MMNPCYRLLSLPIFFLALVSSTVIRIYADTIQIDLPKLAPGALPLSMIRVPAGSFTMIRGTEKIYITLTQDFYLSQHEITQAQWEAVMGFNPCRFVDYPDHPVEMVSWYDCLEFVERINQIGLGKFRLSTVAEWIYAAQAGTETTYYWGNQEDFAIKDQYEWWQGNHNYFTCQVGLKLSNPWGFFDMGGNVGELCIDHFPYYTSDTELIDPIETGHDVFDICGGSIYTPDPYIQVTMSATKRSRFPWVGFRLIKTVDTVPTPTPSHTPSPTATPTVPPIPISTPTPTPTPPTQFDLIGDADHRYDWVQQTELDTIHKKIRQTQSTTFKAFFPSDESAINQDGTILIVSGVIIRNVSNIFYISSLPDRDRMYRPTFSSEGDRLSYGARTNPNEYEYRLFDLIQNRILARRSHRELINRAPGIFSSNENFRNFVVSPDLNTMVFDHPTYPYRFICDRVLDPTSQPQILAKGHGEILDLPPVFSGSGERIFFQGYLNWNFTRLDHYIVQRKENGWITPISLSLHASWDQPVQQYLFDVTKDGKTALIAKNREFFLQHETETGWDQYEFVGISFRTGDQAQMNEDGSIVVIASQRRQNFWIGQSVYDLLVCFKQESGTWAYEKANHALWAEPNFLLSRDGSRLYWTSTLPLPIPTPTPTPEPGTGIPQSEWLLLE